MSDMATPIDKIEKLLKKRKMTWYSLAKAAEVPIPSIYHVKSGRAIPSVYTGIAIAGALGVSVEAIWGTVSKK